MLRFSCLCGRIRVGLSKRPEYIHDCNCTLCRKSGAQWGYFHPSDAEIAGETNSYCRHDKDEPFAIIHFCATCGSTTHFTLTAGAASKFGNTLVGINMSLADEADLHGVELRFPDGRAWSGEGAFGYYREAEFIGRNTAPAPPLSASNALLDS